MGSALLCYRIVTLRSHIDIRQVGTGTRDLWFGHTRVWGTGPGLLTLVSGRAVLPGRPRLSSSRDLPSCLRIESRTKALPAQHLGLLEDISVLQYF